jgi:hypothetical protein
MMDEQRLKYGVLEDDDNEKASSSGFHFKKPKTTPALQPAQSKQAVVNQSKQAPVPQIKSSTGTTYGGTGLLMDIDTTRRLNLCHNCGQKGHYAKFCPLKKSIQVRQQVQEEPSNELDIGAMSRITVEGFLKQWMELHPDEKGFQ